MDTDLELVRLAHREVHAYRLGACKTLVLSTDHTMLFSGIVESGRVHYLINLASEHKKMLLHCPVAMEKDGLTWMRMVQANVKVSVVPLGGLRVYTFITTLQTCGTYIKKLFKKSRKRMTASILEQDLNT